MTLSQQVADFFRVLGNETRINILIILYEKKRSVNEIKEKYEKKFGEIQLTNISMQLSKLYDYNLINYQREGRKKIYRISDDHVLHILNDSIIHVEGGVDCKEPLTCDDNNYSKILEVIQ